MKKRIMFMSIISICIVFFLIAGCAVFFPTDRSTASNPNILLKLKDDQKNENIISIVSERRMVYTTEIDKNNIKDVWRFCAEAPPDTATSFTNNVSGSFSASGDNISGQAQFAKSLASYANQLFYRTQGVQFFRDGAFNLCMAKMDNFISEDQYASLIHLLILESSNRIKDEIPYLADIKGATNPFQHYSSGLAKTKPLQKTYSSAKITIPKYQTK